MITKTPNWVDLQMELFCVTCGTQLVDSGQSCPRCQTPIKVTKSVTQKGLGGKLISVLGASGAGKTVYLGMLLDMLNKGYHGMRGIPNGAFSLEIQQQTISALEHRRFPCKTPSESDKWKWLHCETFDERRPKNRFDLVTPDVAGEALALELDQPGTCSTIHNLMFNSSGIIILLDSQQVRDQSHQEDLFAVKLVTYLDNLYTRSAHERRKKIRTPLAFVFTKTDSCPDAHIDINKFAETNLPGLIQFCNDRFQEFTFFAATVVGGSVTSIDQYGGEFEIPLYVQPQGIVEPLDWVMRRLEKKWSRRP